MLKIGDQAPDFEITTAAGDQETFYGYLSQGPAVVYFYPADFSPVCTREACMFRDVHEELTEHGVRVLGISPQSEEKHSRFRERHQLPFLLVPDPDKRIIKAYDADGPLGLGVRRLSYLVSQEATILDAVKADLRLSQHEHFVKRVLEYFS